MYKISKTQKAEFAKRYAKRDEICNGTPYAIREGCELQFYNINKDKVQWGVVLRHSYGELTGQHTFTLDVGESLVRVKGRNLYPSVITHKRGHQSHLVDKVKQVTDESK